MALFLFSTLFYRPSWRKMRVAGLIRQRVISEALGRPSTILCRSTPKIKRIQTRSKIMRFKKASLDKTIQDLIQTYQNHFGKLGYELLIPAEEDDFTTPIVSDIRQAMLDRNFLSITDVSKLNGKIIKADEFLGNYLETYKRKQESNEQAACFTVQGYEYAFFNPPYGISLEFDEALAIFNQINAYLFEAVDEENLIVTEWETGFSRFFINEWWDFCWGIWSKRKKWLVLVYGTATD